MTTQILTLNWSSKDSDQPGWASAQFELQHEISNNVVYATSKTSDQPAHTRSLIRAIASRWNIL